MEYRCFIFEPFLIRRKIEIQLGKTRNFGRYNRPNGYRLSTQPASVIQPIQTDRLENGPSLAQFFRSMLSAKRKRGQRD